MARVTWPMLRVLVPPSMFGAVIERAKSGNKAVSKWCREVIERALNDIPQAEPAPATPAFAFVADILAQEKEMDSYSFAMALTKVLKQQPVEVDGEETAPQEVWKLVEDLIREQVVLKVEVREGVRFVSLIS